MEVYLYLRGMEEDRLEPKFFDPPILGIPSYEVLIPLCHGHALGSMSLLHVYLTLFLFVLLTPFHNYLMHSMH